MNDSRVLKLSTCGGPNHFPRIKIPELCAPNKEKQTAAAVGEGKGLNLSSEIPHVYDRDHLL